VKFLWNDRLCGVSEPDGYWYMSQVGSCSNFDFLDTREADVPENEADSPVIVEG
jgi:hypothetical protein